MLIPIDCRVTWFIACDSTRLFCCYNLRSFTSVPSLIFLRVICGSKTISDVTRLVSVPNFVRMYANSDQIAAVKQKSDIVAMTTWGKKPKTVKIMM